MNDEEALSVIKKFLIKWIAWRFVMWGIITVALKALEHKLANESV